MFVGHYAVALAAKRVAPGASLGTLFAAASLADLVWPVFLLLGWERAHIVPGPNPFLMLWLDSVPWSHSLLLLLLWGGAFALAYRTRTGGQRAALVVALLVVSHWVLDVVTHRPDMPLYPGGPELGLRLWDSVAGTLVIEGLLFAAGLWVYATGTRARDRRGAWGFWALVAVLVVSYVGSLASPPPPSWVALAGWAIVFGWLFVAWAAWADRHRESVG